MKLHHGRWFLLITVFSLFASFFPRPQMVCHAEVASAIIESELGELSEFPKQLSLENYSEWKSHISPADGELDFQKIPWLVTFKDGILTANKQQKPLLLWTMNGHPLGCT